MYSNLKLRLWHTGTRQNQLADSLGIDETLLSKIINGHRRADVGLRTKIAQLLHANEEWLFEVTEPSTLKVDLAGSVEGLSS